MTRDELLDLFRKSGALLEGHFRLSSGLHSAGYLQCALVLQHPASAEALGAAVAARARDLRPTVVLSPALGGVVIGHEVARALGVRAIFAERQDGALTLRRGFMLSETDRVLVVEDVLTTGGSTRETMQVATAAGVSIQGLIEAALQPLDGREVAVAGAGRTDAGVHACGQVASFTLEREIDAATVARAVNARLPPDVRVVSAAAAAPDFHARFDARTKCYRYRICNADFVSPFVRRYVWPQAGALDVEAMARAARSIEGRHDFAAFQAADGVAARTERTLLSSFISTPEPPEIFYDVVGDGFLRHMVRIVIGSLVEVGRGRRSPAWLREVLASRDRTRAGPTAPAAGLFLMGVNYDERACG